MVKLAKQHWQPSWKSFLFHWPFARDGFATLCLKTFAENSQSQEIFSTESFWSSSLASHGLGSFPQPLLLFPPPFLIFPFLILLNHQGKISRKKNEIHICLETNHTRAMVPFTAITCWMVKFPACFPSGHCYPHRHRRSTVHLKGAGWQQSIPCTSQVLHMGLASFLLKSHILAQGWGLPSFSDGRQVGHTKATLEGMSLRGKRLPLTLAHDPRHAVFW